MAKDILQGGNGDIFIENGDIKFGESTLQHQRDIILTRKGALKHAPDRGVGAEDFIDDESPESLLRETRKQFSLDGQKVKSIKIEGGKIKTNSSYE